MPTNAQLEARDDIDAARARVQLVKEGILSRVDGKSMHHRAPTIRAERWGSDEPETSSRPDFHIPAARPLRLKSAKGVTSFHFSHCSVSKVTYRTHRDGIPNEPGAARGHSRYIERECAVATFDQTEEAVLEMGPEHRGPANSITPSNAYSNRADLGQGGSHSQENDHDHVETAAALERDLHRSMVGQVAPSQPNPSGPDLEGSIEDPGSDAAVQLLSSGDLVCDVGVSECLLLGPEDVSLETGPRGDILRCPPPRDHGNRKEDLADEWSSPFADLDRYLARPSALAIQPDGTRALITNIDPDDDERARFWSLVEQHERNPSPDKMEFRAGDHPAFWDHVLTQPDCPDPIRAKLTGPDRDSSKAVTIGNGKKVRSWLRKQPGWFEAKPDDQGSSGGDRQPIAKFKDGRGGRVQYRIVVEAPEELTLQQNFALLKDFAREFEKRELPFLAVVHAPDEHNHEKNWHFHLTYYDRPARRIGQDDIDGLASKGYDVSALAPGMWDFAVEVPVPGRAKRTTFPLRSNKVKEVSRSREWPKTLRVALARAVNRHLAAAGIERRVSPETYSKMGIVADPHEHLGTKQNALETQGSATPTGIANEEKQWEAIQAQAKTRYEADLADADARIARLLRDQSAGKINSVSELRAELARAAKLRRDAFLLDQEMERATSRAVMVRDRNVRLLKAWEADPRKSREREVARSRSMVGAATRYLMMLEQALTDERALATRWRATARRCMDNAADLERRISAIVESKTKSVQPVSKKSSPERKAEASPAGEWGPRKVPVQSRPTALDQGPNASAQTQIPHAASNGRAKSREEPKPERPQSNEAKKPPVDVNQRARSMPPPGWDWEL